MGQVAAFPGCPPAGSPQMMACAALAALLAQGGGALLVVLPAEEARDVQRAAVFRFSVLLTRADTTA